MDAKGLIPLSPTEVLILKYLWELGGKARAKAVAKMLREYHDRTSLSLPYSSSELTDTTITTLLYRMRDKGYVRTIPPEVPRFGSGPGRPAHIYIPIISYKEGLRRYFEGLLEDLPLNAEDFEILKSVLCELRARLGVSVSSAP
jgi:hypothetical protein